MSDALYDNIENAPIFETGSYIQHGKAIWKNKRTIHKSGHRGESFIAEFEAAVILEQGKDPELVVGGGRNLVVNLTKQKEMGLGKVRAYLLAACSSLYQRAIDPKAVKKEFVKACLAPTQPLAGTYVLCEAIDKLKDKPKAGENEFWTNLTWTPLTDADLVKYNLKQPAAPTK